MNWVLCVRLLAVVLMVAVCQGCATREGLNMQAKDAQLRKGVDIPVNVPLGIYVPEVRLKERFFIDSVSAWMTPGDDMRAALVKAGNAYFGSVEFIDAEQPSENEFAVFMSLAPAWEFEAGKIEMTMGYRFYDADGTLLKSGQESNSKQLGPYHAATGFYNSTLKAMQLVMVDTINSVFVEGREFTGRSNAVKVDRDLLVNLDKPIRTGTAFFISESGQLLTAAHVTNGCLKSQLNFAGAVHDVEITGVSELLDVAMLDSDVSTNRFLPMRRSADVVLGERVATAGFPLANLLANSANLTVGNVSSLRALPGSMGKFQFSAPVQPGSSGGPLISERGELIGMTTGTLNVAALAERGVVPQNVNFALSGEYIVKFVERHNGDLRWFEDGETQPNIAAVNEHLAESVAQLACYQ